MAKGELESVQRLYQEYVRSTYVLVKSSLCTTPTIRRS